METVYLTHDGLEKLRRELERVMKEVRPDATHQLAVARAHGDLSENAEYDAAKAQLAEIDQRIHTLRTQLSHVQIIDESLFDHKEVRILSKVTLKNVSTGSVMTYSLVDPLQSDPKKNLISVKSPIGKGLLGKKVGDEATITVPAGEIRLVVTAIEASVGL